MAETTNVLQVAESKIIDKIRKSILEIKIPNEWNIVSIYWADTSYYLSNKLDPKHFCDNNARVYYIIGSEIVKEGKSVITDIEAGLYLQKHSKLRKVYDDAGGYETIEQLGTYINKDNIDGYINEFNKYWALMTVNEYGWLSSKDYKKFVDYDISRINDYYNARINDVFIKADNDVKSYNISHGLDDLIEKSDKGAIMGLPLYNSPMLSNQIGGWRKGELYLFGAITNGGKSTTTMELLLPSIIKHDEKLVWFANESSIEKIQREMLTIVINNHFKHNFDKDRFKHGGFTDEEREWLLEAKAYLEELQEKNHITVIPLLRYNVDTVIKLIRKYSAMGVGYFVLDTFKASTDAIDEVKEMTRDSVKLYDTIKEEACNVALWCTLQLTKDSINKRFLTTFDIGRSKNIADVASTIILFRNMWTEEKHGGSKFVRVSRKLSEKSKQEISIEQDDFNNFPIMFVTKNREGIAGEYQIVARNDLGRNMYGELGTCIIPREDY